MKKCRVIGLFAAVCLLSGSLLSGCGSKVTAESLMEDAQKNVQKAESFDGDLAVEMNMGIDEGALSMGIGLNAEMDMQVISDPVAYHMAGTVGIDLLDMKFDMEMYGRETDGEVETYLNAGEGWQKSTAQESDADTEDVVDLGVSLMDASNYELQDKTETFHDQEAYVITAKLEGDDFADMWEELQGTLSAAEELTDDVSLDLTGLTADITYYIYKDTKLPASIMLTVEGEDAVLTEVDGIGIMLQEMTFTMNFYEFDNVDEIVIPQEALDAPEEDAAADSLTL